MLDFDHSVWPRLPYAVIDQNCLRDAGIVTEAIDEAKKGRLILLHDIAIVEMTKSKQWSDTLTRSFKILAQYPQGCVAGHATGALMRGEMNSGEPHIDIIDHEWTPRLRQCLRDIAAGTGPVLAVLEKTVPKAKKVADAQQLNRRVNKQILLSAVEAWKGELSGEQLKALRRGDDELFRQLLAEKRTIETIANELHQAEYRPEAARFLAAVPSVSAHNWLCLAANALDWVVRGGIESLPEERFTNELCDVDYLVAASFCDALITKEKKMRRLHDHLRHVLDRRWSEVRQAIQAAQRGQ